MWTSLAQGLAWNTLDHIVVECEVETPGTFIYFCTKVTLSQNVNDHLSLLLPVVLKIFFISLLDSFSLERLPCSLYPFYRCEPRVYPVCLQS